jgi:hypothetical protein
MDGMLLLMIATMCALISNLSAAATVGSIAAVTASKRCSPVQHNTCRCIAACFDDSCVPHRQQLPAVTAAVLMR